MPEALTGVDQLKDLVRAYRRLLALLAILIAAPLPIQWLLPMYTVDVKTAWNASAVWGTVVLSITGTGCVLLIQRSNFGKGIFRMRVRTFLFLAGAFSLVAAALGVTAHIGVMNASAIVAAATEYATSHESDDRYARDALARMRATDASLDQVLSIAVEIVQQEHLTVVIPTLLESVTAPPMRTDLFVTYTFVAVTLKGGLFMVSVAIWLVRPKKSTPANNAQKVSRTRIRPNTTFCGVRDPHH